MTGPCIFCEIAAGRAPARVVYGDGEHIAFFPLEHVQPGHVVLIPRRHTDYLFDLEDASYHNLTGGIVALHKGFRY